MMDTGKNHAISPFSISKNNYSLYIEHVCLHTAGAMRVQITRIMDRFCKFENEANLLDVEVYL